MRPGDSMDGRATRAWLFRSRCGRVHSLCCTNRLALTRQSDRGLTFGPLSLRRLSSRTDFRLDGAAGPTLRSQCPLLSHPSWVAAQPTAPTKRHHWRCHSPRCSLDAPGRWHSPSRWCDEALSATGLPDGMMQSRAHPNLLRLRILSALGLWFTLAGRQENYGIHFWRCDQNGAPGGPSWQCLFCIPSPLCVSDATRV